MLSGSARPAEDVAIEFLHVPDGGWVACDRGLQEDDPRRVIAHVDCSDSVVKVTWVRRPGAVCSYDTMGDALQAMSASLNDVGEAARGSRTMVRGVS
jgi:hypothetical protein